MIIFFDIDGTLIDLSRGINSPTEKTKEAIKLLREKGHFAIIASARAEMPNYFKGMEFDGFIGGNGSIIEFKGEIIREVVMSKEQVEELIDIFKTYKGQFNFKGKKDRWVSSLNHPLMLKQMELFGGNPDDGRIVDWNVEDIKATKATVIFETEKQLNECADALPSEWEYDAYSDVNYRIDINMPGCTKGKGVRYLYEALGINYEDTMAFGDNLNDIDMLQNVKYGIAMGNATEKLKEIAYSITEDVTRDGIYEALSKMNII